MKSTAPLRWVVACLAMTFAAPAAIAAGAPTGGTTAPDGGGTTAAAALGGTPPAASMPPTPNSLVPPPAGGRIGVATLVRGYLTPAQAGRTVALQLFDAARGWVAIGSARAAANGAFVVGWRPAHIGRFLLRAIVGGKASSATPGLTATIEVFRSVLATVFGPGSYGSRTACGQVLTPALVGVAHPTLPCGTMVDIAYGSKTISVPVIDRGPYANGASYDLTMATAAELGVADTVHIGAVALHGPSPVAP
jgi:rare lipoprotein A